MNAPCLCCSNAEAMRAPVLDLKQFCILFSQEGLCIARCNQCGDWLSNEAGQWEPLLQYQYERAHSHS